MDESLTRDEADGRRGASRSVVDLRILRYFLAVADEGNITWAAELLRISQPTLSRQLRNLEAGLGVTLFRRGPHRITLTPEGRLLRERAQELVEMADRMERDVRDMHGSLSGTISISCAETRSMDWLSAHMAAFRARYPGVSFEVRSCTADVTDDRLELGIADLGLVTEPLDVSQYDYLRTHVADRWCILMRDDDPLAARSAISPDDMTGRAVILPFREEVRDEFVSWLGGSLRDVAIAGTFDLGGNVMAMVRQGVGLAMTFDIISPGRGLCLRPMSPQLEFGGAVIWKRGRTPSPAAAAFVEFLRADDPRTDGSRTGDPHAGRFARG